MVYQLEVLKSNFGQHKIFDQAFQVQVHKHTLQKPFLEHKGCNHSNHSGVEVVLSLSARDLLLHSLVEALAELADCVGNRAYFLNDLLAKHVDELEQLV